MLDYERKAQQEGYSLIIGIDEAGRGPLAGPVVAAAVAFKEFQFENKIFDSKKITHRQREKAFHEILEKAYVGVGIVSESVIDENNILEATYHAMSVAVNQIVDKVSDSIATNKNFNKEICLLVDGNSFKSDLPFRYKTICKGDALSYSIAGASIVAKVTRDRILEIYDQIFPEYGFKRHKGYPTLQHKLAIKEHGLSVIHRKTFKHT